MFSSLFKNRQGYHEQNQLVTKIKPNRIIEKKNKTDMNYHCIVHIRFFCCQDPIKLKFKLFVHLFERVPNVCNQCKQIGGKCLYSLEKLMKLAPSQWFGPHCMSVHELFAFWVWPDRYIGTSLNFTIYRTWNKRFVYGNQNIIKIPTYRKIRKQTRRLNLRPIKNHSI